MVENSMITVCYTADSGYAMQVAVSMVSMLDHNKTQKIQFYILGDNYNEDIRRKFKQVEQNYHTNIQILDIRNKMRILADTALAKEPGIMKNGIISFMFARLFMGSSLPESITKVIYIDCDTLYINDIRKLYDTQLEDEKIFAAVRDLWPISYNKTLGLPENELYFQSGIMLVDLNRWRAERCEEQLIALAQKATHYYHMHDQDLLNLCFYGRIQTLSPSYGMVYILRHYSAQQILWFSSKSEEHYYSKEKINMAKQDTHVVHYAGDYYGRPWEFPNACQDSRLWYSYYVKTPWGNQPIGIPYCTNLWLKYSIKKLVAPFAKTFWLHRTKKRFEKINTCS
jgi:lipopolysaccharide biosynthesis glycosyltransferase